ncbi:T-complex protein 1 subunit theta [Lepeophtheirus salmonis]|uniref:CCT-theta n=1 Tax=Lepeophtheirus salmonis TaxID=72036 RepID=A0A0K2TI90_LEPSM|nr:T-complex protein 1 subunit theta-like [Lepeophtheirus salmonis]
MALHVPKAPGFSSMMKDGARFLSGLEEAVINNISACKEFTSTLGSAYGPNGMNKMVINHLEKLFVTNDAGTIMRELEVEHPAVKIMVLASQMMEQEVGDGTNFVVVFCGALLKEAEDLLRMGLKPTEVAEGYELALEKAIEILETLSNLSINNNRSAQEVQKAICASVMSKQYGYQDFLSELITKACISILPEETSFNVDNIRVCKILGSGLLQSQVLPGMVFLRAVESNIINVKDAKIAIYTCPVDQTQTETKGTVLIKTAQELKDFSKGEEDLLEGQIKAIKDAGIDVIVSGGKIGDLAMHYINKYDIMAIRLTSKWDVRRLCRTVGATPLPKMTAPTKEEMGFADKVYVDELGDTSVVIFKLESKESRVATVVVRGSTENYMDDIERAIDDGVNTFKGLCREPRLVPGAGATEIALSIKIGDYAKTCPGLDQYAINRFSLALQSIPRILAENSGLKSSEMIAQLLSAHQEGNSNAGVDIDAPNAAVVNTAEKEIYDLLLTKFWGIKYATDAACTILRVDQMIMAKRAGGPKARGGGAMDQDDD